MATQIVQQGRAAWKRLKKGRANYDDWVLVGHALIEGRKVAMRNAGCGSPAGRGYSDAFGDWLLHNRLDLKPSQRAKLFVMMGILPEVEQWRLTLTPTQRLRMNHPGVVLQNYQKAAGRDPTAQRFTADHRVVAAEGLEDNSRLKRVLRLFRAPCAVDALRGFPDDPLLGVRATILLRIDWLSGLIGALLW